MHGRASALMCLALLAGCGCDRGSNEAAVRAVMADQERAWDAGDIEGFMAGYAPEICFTGRGGLTCGKADVTADYKKAYPDAASMGDLTFGIGELLFAGDRHAWMTGTWELRRTGDTLDGGFTLLWEKRSEGWLILRDHSY